MVENVADDGVDPKPTIIEASDEASGDVKSTVNVKLKVKILDEPIHTGMRGIPKGRASMGLHG